MAEVNGTTTTGKAERVRELMRTVGMLPVLVLLLVVMHLLLLQKKHHLMLS